MSLKRILFISLLVVLVFTGSAVGQHKPIRVEAKIGLPNLLGGSAEYLLPNLGNKYIDNSIAPFIDFSAFGLSLDETTDLDYKYFGFGAKYYLDNHLETLGLPKNLMGVYGGLGFGRMSLELTDNDWTSIIHGDGSATGSIGVSMFQIKIGKRWMWGPFTVCVETGYSLGSMDNEIKVDVEYEDGFKETDTEDISDVPLDAGAIGAVSFGIAL